MRSSVSSLGRWGVLRKKQVFGVLALGLAGIGLYGGRNQTPQAPKVSRYPTEAIHLVSEQGVPLVEVVEVGAEGAPQRLERYWCRVRNNTNKEITAVAIVWTIVWSDGVSEDAEQVFQSSDTRFDEDGRFLAPGATISFESLGPHLVEGGKKFLTRVRVSVDYVEFADRTSAGPDRSDASRRIALVRRGGEAYRRWLLQIYREQGSAAVANKLLRGSEEESLEQLEEAETSLSPPQEIPRLKAWLRQGARMSRQRLLSLYREQGIEGVVERLLRND
ncbi:hypothetical protein HRbin08_02101 [bacterium HR08]|nr:hypothetical protein HRbin08_02101 [bacterium HR08]